MENLDNPNSIFPDDIRAELKKMAGWMTFIGILSIIGSAFGLIGDLTSLAQGLNPAQILVNMAVQGFGIYVAIILLQKASSFGKVAATSSTDELLIAMNKTHQYWMYSVIIIAVNFVIGIIFRG